MTITEVPKDVTENFAKYIVFREMINAPENYQSSLTKSLEKVILMLTGYLVLIENVTDKTWAEKEYEQIGDLMKFYQFISQKLSLIEAEEVTALHQQMTDILKLIKKIRAKLRHALEGEMHDLLAQHTVNTFSEMIKEQKI
jgi:hypothetical protein